MVVGSGAEELAAAGLAAVGRGEPAAGVVTGQAAGSAGTGKVAFVFAGQGPQWPGHGRGPAGCPAPECSRPGWPSLRQSAEPTLTGWDLLDQVIRDGRAALDKVDVVQPTLWAVMVSLAALWQAAGVTPDVVAGHSQGEIAAACVAVRCPCRTRPAWWCIGARRRGPNCPAAAA